LETKSPKVTIFWGKQKLNLPYLDHRFLYVASIMWGLKINIVSSLTCSQISLSSLAYIWLPVHQRHKIGGKKRKRITSILWYLDSLTLTKLFVRNLKFSKKIQKNSKRKILWGKILKSGWTINYGLSLDLHFPGWTVSGFSRREKKRFRVWSGFRV
jgi:hypothetical protein